MLVVYGVFRAIWLAGAGLPLALAFSLSRPRSTSQPTASIDVDTKVQYQEVDGFGCSEAFQRAEDIFGEYGLSAANINYVLDLLFSEELGAGFTILRNGIGSSNSSASNYMNSIEPYSPGSPTATPHYTFNYNDSDQFPLAQQAYARGLQTLYGDAWSAPGYMKTNDDDSYGGYLCGVTNTSCSTGNWMQAYANYLVQWARFYIDAGVPVTNIGFLNEPQLDVDYASMLSDGTQAAEFIRVLAKTIDASGLDLKINCCDGVGWEEQEDMLPGLQAGPDPAIDYLSVITGHGYDSPPNFTLSTTLKTWLTEWADLSGDYTPYTFFEDGGPGEGLTWASYIQVAFVNANVSGFLYWEGVENSTSNSALINLLGNTVIPSKRFWTFAQFSKFVRPGARRVQATSSDPLVTVSSFLNQDGRLATQIINNATTAYTLDFSISSYTSTSSLIQPYLTDNTNNLTQLSSINVDSNGKFSADVPPRSLVSFVGV